MSEHPPPPGGNQILHPFYFGWLYVSTPGFGSDVEKLPPLFSNLLVFVKNRIHEVERLHEVRADYHRPMTHQRIKDKELSVTLGRPRLHPELCYNGEDRTEDDCGQG